MSNELTIAVTREEYLGGATNRVIIVDKDGERILGTISDQFLKQRNWSSPIEWAIFVLFCHKQGIDWRSR